VHFVYIVRCADGTLYTGYARDPRARERAHNSGRGAKYTAGRRPVRLIYQEAFRSVGKALAREHVVKQLTRAQKDALVVSARRRHHRTSTSGATVKRIAAALVLTRSVESSTRHHGVTQGHQLVEPGKGPAKVG
jgi:putative endonuclease